MQYAALASGSNGNCYYVAGEEGQGILIDIGINAKHVERHMHNLQIDPRSISAIFITHEHTDHIRGLSVFSKRYEIPVYLTPGTYKGTRLHLPESLVHLISSSEKVAIGGLSVQAIPKYHDAKEPTSFVVSDGALNLSIMTDLGRVCPNVQHVIEHSDVLLLEANYDEELLESGRYSYYLKNRIRSGWGHLSNKLALDALLNHRTDRLKHLILGHLSGQNNSPELVEETFSPHCKQIKLSIASRHESTLLFDTRDLK